MKLKQQQKTNGRFSVDWKAGPDEVMKQCTRMLKQMGVDVTITSVDTGSDVFTFVAVKGAAQ